MVLLDFGDIRAYDSVPISSFVRSTSSVYWSLRRAVWARNFPGELGWCAWWTLFMHTMSGLSWLGNQGFSNISWRISPPGSCSQTVLKCSEDLHSVADPSGKRS